jgi:hypothetical protein
MSAPVYVQTASDDDNQLPTRLPRRYVEPDVRRRACPTHPRHGAQSRARATVASAAILANLAEWDF